jgi:predicted transcriptional regulator
MRKALDKNRSKFEIIAEILRKLREPTCRTNIMSHCNMSSMQSGHYLTFMKSNDLVRMNATDGKVTYQRTETGREFLEQYNKIVMLLVPSVAVGTPM